jgi:DNA primase
MGTALTPRQVLLLKRLSEKMVAIFDGDSAGQAAAVKSVPQLVDGGLEARIATLPAGEDPDSLLVEKGEEAMAEIIAAAIPAVDFLMEFHQRGMEDTIPGKARLLELVAPVVARLKSEVARELYARKLATLITVDISVVQRAIRGERRAKLEQAVRGGMDGPRAAPGRAEEGKTKARVVKATLGKSDRIGFKILGILKEHPHLARMAEEAQLSRLLTNEALHATYNAALKMLREEGSITASKLLEETAVEIKDDLARVINDLEWVSEEADTDPTRALEDCIGNLESIRIRKELEEVKVQIVGAGRDGDIELCRILFQRQHELKIELRDLQR